MYKRNLFALFFVAISCFSLAQTGENVYTFLNVPVSARQSALGGDAVSIRDFDVSLVNVNPSLMNLDMDNRVSVNYASYLADSKFGTLSYVRDLGEGHLVAFNARFMVYGDMPSTDESGTISGDFKASDAMLGLSYAYQFESNWTIGGSVNFISSKIDTYTSMAVAGTGAITYHLDESKESISLIARNFGYQFKTFNGERETLPFRIDLGYTKILDQFPIAITITAHDLQKFNISQDYNTNGQEVKTLRKIADHFSIGAELFPEQSFNFRLGYNVKRGNELAVLDQRSFAGLSVGFGVKISYFRFDYSHARYHNSSNMNMFGLTIDLIEIGGNRR